MNKLLMAVFKKPAVGQRSLSLLKASNFTVVSAVRSASLPPVTAPTASVEWPHSHAGHFKIERYWAAVMLPLFPAAYFIHNPLMDYALSIAIVMHIHWGLFGVVQDYARPFVIGENLAKLARVGIYFVTILLFASLLHFNYNDVGTTKAFEMIWSL